MTDTRVMAVDPPDCGCTDCLTGYSVPLDQISRKQAIKLYFDKLNNRTSGFTIVINVTLIDVTTMANGRACGTVAAATLIGGYLGNSSSMRTWNVTEIMQRGDLCCDCVGDCDCDYDD